MTEIPGYEIKEKLFDGTDSSVLRAVRKIDNKPVIIKILKSEYPSLVDIAKFTREYEITILAKQSGVPEVYGLEKIDHTLAIVFEDIGGCSLEEILKKKHLSLAQILSIAIQIVDIIGRLHERTIIHKDINPYNIVINEDNYVLQIVDFSISSTLPYEKPEIFSPNLLEGTLEYISPEQTGRMNRGIDYRTDYYSLGVLLYRMLTGRLPFESKDPSELIHYQIAKMPTPLNQIDTKIPEVLSQIVLKLLAKTVEGRYQSIKSLKSDLQMCLDQLNRTGKIDPFPIALHDLSIEFKIPEKLYGRELQIDTLLKSFDEASLGKIRLLLVSGYSGIGKTSLVQEIQKPVLKKRGYYVSGKFDQFRQNIPYSAIIQALEQWIQMILVEGQETITIWKKKLDDALGTNGGVVTEVLPTFEKIIGPQQKPVDLLPIEAKNRFNFVFVKLIQTLATRDHPLVLFLDDLQRADASSLHLIESLVSHHDSKYILIICAYRDNEVDSSHILKISLAEMEKLGISFDTILLGPLPEEVVSQIIADTLQTTTGAVQLLAQLCYSRTQGNPFFLSQLLQYFYVNKSIYLDESHQHWTWDIAEIQKKGVTNDIAELMTKKIQGLQEKTQQAIEVASCIEFRFDLLTVANVLQKTGKETLSDLWQAIEEGLILPEDEDYKYVKEGDNSGNCRFRFLHDRVQQAAYGMMQGPKRSEIHQKIAHFLIKSTPKERLNENIFAIVNQLHLSEDLIRDKIEFDQYIRWNLVAAIRAKEAASFKTAVTYLQIAQAKLSADSWEINYDLSLNIYKLLAECLYTVGQHEQAGSLVELIFAHIKNKNEKVSIYCMQVFQLSALGRLDEAITCGLKGLELVGVKISEHPKMITIIKEVIIAKWTLGRRSISSLADAPLLEPGPVLDLIKLLNAIRVSSYFSGRKSLLVLVILKSTILSMRHGISEEAAIAYGNHGVIMHSYFGDLKRGEEFMRLGVEINEKLNDLRNQAGIQFIYVQFCLAWKIPFKLLQYAFNKVIEMGLKSGDLLWVTQACQQAMLWDPEMPRDVNYEESIKYGKIIQESRIQASWDLFKIAQLYQGNLAGKTLDRYSLSDESHDELKALERLKNGGYNIGVGAYYLRKAVVYFTYGKFREAFDYIIQSSRYEKAMLGTITHTDFHFYSFLIRVAAYPFLGVKEKFLNFYALKNHLRKMKKWAAYCPVNFEHKKLLMEAEFARLQKKTKRARLLYEEAIEKARKCEFLNIEALGNELAARFYLSEKQRSVARSFLLECYYSYFKYGAKTKLEYLQESYPQILTEQATRFVIPTINILPLKGVKTTHLSTKTSSLFDLNTVIKSSQVISEEIIFDNLLKSMMHIVIENAGAEKGWLVLENEGRWIVEAEGTIDKVNLTSSTIESLPITLINSIIFDKLPRFFSNPAKLNEFAADSYMQRVQPKSVLCLPLINHGELRGMIYLENNLTQEAFNPETIGLLNLLGSQIAISIDNAKFYADITNMNKKLSDLNQSLTRFVPQEFLAILEKKSILEVTPGDSIRKEMTVLFSDIRGFTTLSESMSPSEIFKFLNNFLKFMVPVIEENHGFIDKYLGDGIMALFPKNADTALKAAVGLLRALDVYNRERGSVSTNVINIGIGINTGMLILGIIGDENRLEGTVTSDAVNIASRVQDSTKLYSVPLLITEETYKHLQNPDLYHVRKIDTVLLRGKSKLVTLYEVYDADPPDLLELKEKTKAEFEQAVILYGERRYKESFELFDKIAQNNTKDLPAEAWRNIVKQLL